MEDRTARPDRGGTPPGTAEVLRGPGSATFASRLERWVADARVDEEALRRARERWLQDAAEQEATLVGVLADLAERHAPVTLETTAGRRHHGLVQVIGVDFVALRVRSGAEVLVALAAVELVRTSPSVDATTGDRMLATELRLAEVLGRLAGDRERARLVTRRGDAAVSGELRSVGHDVVVVRVDGDQRSTAYVPIAAVSEVTLA